MERVQSYGQWSLFCPNEAPGLADCWGDEFEKLYAKYEKEVSRFAVLIIEEHSKHWLAILFFLFFRARPRKLSQHRISGSRF